MAQSLLVFPLLACLVSSVCLLVLVLPRFVAVCYLLVLFISLCCFVVVVVVVLWSIITCLEASLMLVLIEILLMCLLKVVGLAFLQHLQLSFVCDGSSCFILSLVMVISVNCIRISLIFQSVIW